MIQSLLPVPYHDKSLFLYIFVPFYYFFNDTVPVPYHDTVPIPFYDTDPISYFDTVTIPNYETVSSSL